MCWRVGVIVSRLPISSREVQGFWDRASLHSPGFLNLLVFLLSAWTISMFHQTQQKTRAFSPLCGSWGTWLLTSAGNSSSLHPFVANVPRIACYRLSHIQHHGHDKAEAVVIPAGQWYKPWFLSTPVGRRETLNACCLRNLSLPSGCIWHPRA